MINRQTISWPLAQMTCAIASTPPNKNPAICGGVQSGGESRYKALLG